MWTGIKRELRYLAQNRWDLVLVTLLPCFLIILFANMFAQGKAEHIPIALIDQDHSQLSYTIQQDLQLNPTLKLILISAQQDEAEQQLNQTTIWGYILIPAGAEQRLVKAQDAQIAIAYNQSFFSIGNSISSAMQLSTLRGIAHFLGQEYLQQKIPYLDGPTPNVKISTLYNPNLSYEFYLEPFVVPAILHLLLGCCVAFSVGQELKFHRLHEWQGQGTLFQAIFSKNLVYVLIFCGWTWLWMFWLIVIRGWFIAGHWGMLLLAQMLFYFAYALISSCIVLGTQNLSKSFGVIALYGGSSLSFAGVTLPVNNAPILTKIWSNLLPYTPYAKLQTEQWVVGSPIMTSFVPFLMLLLHCSIYAVLAIYLLKKAIRSQTE